MSWLTAHQLHLSWQTKRYIMTFFQVPVLILLFRLLAPTQSIFSINKSLLIWIGPLVSLVISISNAIMAVIKLSPLWEKCKTVLMVSGIFWLFTLTNSFHLLGPVNHLHVHFSVMHCLYLVLKEQSEGVDGDEAVIAQGWKVLNPAKASKYLQWLNKASAIIVQMFAQQSQCDAVSLHTWLISIPIKTLSGQELGPG